MNLTWIDDGDIRAANARALNATRIIAVAATYYGHTTAEMLGRGRHHPLAEHRQVAMFLCRELTDLSMPSIGLAFGRDHSTVVYACKRIRRARGRLQRDIEALTALLKAGAHA